MHKKKPTLYLHKNALVHLAVLLLFLPMSGYATDLHVRLTGSATDGQIVFMLFDSAAGFSGFNDPVKTVSETWDARDFYTFEEISAGSYAVVAYLDLNQNNLLDRNFIGIPNEPIGISNGYRPKGPPEWGRAVFELDESTVQTININLTRPLGKQGRFAAGIGAVGGSRIYRGDDSDTVSLIPALSYTGKRLQILGPNIRWGLFRSDNWRMALTGAFRPGAYDNGDSDYLLGMGSRSDTFMAGVAWQTDLTQDLELQLSYNHDVLNKIGGGAAQVEIEKSLMLGKFRTSFGFAVNWLSDSLTNHDFGVPTRKQTELRPAWQLEDSTSAEAGFGLLFNLQGNWIVVMNSSIEFFDDAVSSSPIVDSDYDIGGFLALNYSF